MELIVVILVIGILASIATPQLQKAVEKSRQGEAITILNNMYKGYKIAIMDGIILPCDTSYNFPPNTPQNPSSDFCIDNQNKRWFNPDESDLFPSYNTDHSANSWAALGFEENPNVENPNYYFSYDFLKPLTGSWTVEEDHSTGPTLTGRGSTDLTAPRPADGDCSVCGPFNLGVAWRKDGPIIEYGLYHINSTKWIAIDMDTGKIYKSAAYK